SYGQFGVFKHEDLRRLPGVGAVRDALRNALGKYDLTLSYPELLDRCDLHLGDGALGLALMAVVDFLALEPGEIERRPALERLTRVVRGLAELEVNPRATQLRELVLRLRTLIEDQRTLPRARALITRIQRDVQPDLEKALPEDDPTLAWFRFQLHYWALTYD